MTDQTTEDLEAQKIWEDLDKKEAEGTLHAQVDPPKEDGQQATDEKTDQKDDAPADEKTADAENTEQKPADGQEPPANDIWATTDPALKAAYDAALQETTKTKADWKRMAGTVAGYQRKIDGLQKQLEGSSKPAEGAKDDKATETTSGIFDDPEIKKAAEDYPEVFGPLQKIVKTLEQRAEKAERELGGISEERRAANLEDQTKVVYDEHPDYDQIAATKEFYDWYKAAPAYIQAGVNRNAENIVDGSEVSHIVKLFKAETGIGQTKTQPPEQGNQQNQGQSERRKHQLEGASSPAPRGPAKVQSGVPDDPEAAWKYFEELDRKKAQTR